MPEEGQLAGAYSLSEIPACQISFSSKGIESEQRRYFVGLSSGVYCLSKTRARITWARSLCYGVIGASWCYTYCILEDIGRYVQPGEHTDYVLVKAFESNGLAKALFVFNEALKTCFKPGLSIKHIED
jgi:hypothetical protein